jgi:hypothetical protein
MKCSIYKHIGLLSEADPRIERHNEASLRMLGSINWVCHISDASVSTTFLVVMSKEAHSNNAVYKRIAVHRGLLATSANRRNKP